MKLQKTEQSVSAVTSESRSITDYSRRFKSDDKLNVVLFVSCDINQAVGEGSDSLAIYFPRCGEAVKTDTFKVKAVLHCLNQHISKGETFTLTVSVSGYEVLVQLHRPTTLTLCSEYMLP